MIICNHERNAYISLSWQFNVVMEDFWDSLKKLLFVCSILSVPLITSKVFNKYFGNKLKIGFLTKLFKKKKKKKKEKEDMIRTIAKVQLRSYVSVCWTPGSAKRLIFGGIFFFPNGGNSGIFKLNLTFFAFCLICLLDILKLHLTGSIKICKSDRFGFLRKILIMPKIGNFVSLNQQVCCQLNLQL